MRKYAFTISIRLSDEDKLRYERLLQRFAETFHRSKSEQFRSLLRKLDFPYETKWDNEGYDDLPDVSEIKDPDAEKGQ